MADQRKVCIITGANTGIGKETAKELAKLGYHVILACRDQKRCELASSEIIEYCNKLNIKQTPLVECMHIDLTSLQSVQKFVENFNKRNINLDILINNAGVFCPPLSYTKEGFELQFGVNYLSHFKLTLLLLNKLQQSPHGKIINVASRAHKAGKIDFENFRAEKNYFSYLMYGQSKLAQILFTYELDRKLKSSNIYNVTVNAVHPGLVKTDIQRNFTKGLFHWFFNSKLSKYFMLNVQQGAQPIIMLATTDEKISGKYFSKMNEAKSSKVSYDENLSKKLWDVSKQICDI